MATDTDTKQLRAGIVTAVRGVRTYITAIKGADLPFLSWDYVCSVRTHVEQKRAEFVGVQDRVIATAASEDVVKRESSIKEDFLSEVDEVLSHIEKMLTRMVPPPAAPAAPDVKGPDAGDFCALMREMMAQNQQQMMQLISTFTSSTASTSNSFAPLAKPPIKLPQINLPTFGGSYAEWMPFKDRFESCIIKHPALSDVDKLEYLQSALSGDAASTIKHLPTIKANFSVAWKLLQERYELKNKIVADHVRSFYKMPSVSGDPHAIRSVYNLLSESLLALDALQVTGRDPWIIQFTLDKLDTESRVLWGRECGSEVPTLEQFRKFLNQRCIDATNASDPPSNTPSNTRSQSSKSHHDSKKKLQALHNAPAASTCRCCSEAPHPLYRCPRFIAQSPTERFETVKKLNLCRNCLASHHTSTCTFHNCKKCQARHNVLLHEKFTGGTPANPSAPSSHPSNVSSADRLNSSSDNPPNPSPGGSAVSLAASTRSTDCHPSTFPKVFLATAMVDILTGDHQRIPCRVMLDGGAQVCIMTTSLYQRLKLPKAPSNISILGVGSQVNSVKHKVTATIFSQKNGQSFTFDCYILPKISGNIPNWAIDSAAIRVPPGVAMADPQWNVQRPVDLLICGDAYWGSLLAERITLGVGLPHLQHTAFGYVMVGEHRPLPHVAHVNHVQVEPALDEALTRFWEIEDLPDEPSITDQQLEAEAHFTSTYRRNDEGRFVVRLPFREGPGLLGDSRPQAVSQLFALERQFERKPRLKELYTDVMRDYMARGWLELVPPEDLNAPSYYMPHHGVLKESSSTTKLRVVYNASAKSSSGHSLNDLLLIGPQVQPDIAIILLQFRLKPFAMTADISKMYLQVLLDPADANFQRLVYRESSYKPIRDYRIPRVCFGVASSPFLATRALIQLAHDHEEDFPLASSALRSSFYVDDCIISASSLSEAEEIQRQLREVLHRGGFLLTKWSSNHETLRPPPVQDSSSGEVTVESPISSALGVSWDSERDVFRFLAPVDINEEIKTKRHMASGIAKFYDPIGLLGPVVIEGKILLQDLHMLQRGWDEAVPGEHRKKWKDFVLRLQAIPELNIPRWTSCILSPDRVELHAFADASTRAYGVAVYIVTSSGSQFCSRLLLSKSRVAPIKRKLTIPKLELCGATLAVETVAKFKDVAMPNAIHFWSDSTIVLHWIYSPPESYKVFVAHRIRRIRDQSTPDQWRHVVSEENAADIISRGASPAQLMDNTLWFEGPEFLRGPRSNWPPPFDPSGQAAEEVECLVASASESLFNDLLRRHSGLPKVQRIVAYVLRFLDGICRQPTRKTSQIVVATEMERALLYMVRTDQQGELSEAYSHLTRHNGLPREHKSLMSLTPFMDEEGIIRVGGRLANADEPFFVRHPALLPKSLLAYRIARHEHVRRLHAGPTLLLAAIRQRFWPISGRNLVRKVVHECLRCYRAKPRPLEQLMGDLPGHRVNLQRPFQATGVDFAGPLHMLSSATRGARSRRAGTQKVYIAVFVCMATKAAHLELVSSLSTEAFIAALRRFSARRLTPRHIYSDCGKNFEGAANELVRLFNQEESQREIVSETQQDGITWHFNPPASPHHGGLWEACVKSVKHHLVRSVGTAPLSYEEFVTILCQIESILNSRPLCLLSDDPNEGGCLTPGHFLTGDVGDAPPNPDLTSIPENRLSHWQHCQWRAQEFGRKWRLQYLNTLQQRPRWRHTRENLAVDDVVLLLDETNREGSKWVLGRVLQVHPGADGRVRVVTVKTARGTYKRPITKIASLPSSSEEPSGRRQPEDDPAQPGEDVQENLS